MQFRRLILVLGLALGMGAAPALAAGGETLAPVRTVTTENWSSLPKEYREFLGNPGPIDPAHYPGLDAKLPEIQNLVEKLLLPKDGAAPISVVIVDDAQVNAALVRSSKLKSRVLILNAGLLEFVENDDQLAFVIGHELEHGTSEIETYIASKTAVPDQLTLYDRVDIAFRQKAIENEVDLKSLVSRVHEKGFSPEQAREFTIRMREAFGDHLSDDHTLWSTRLDAIEGALTGLERGAGEHLKSGISHEIFDAAMKEALSSPTLRAYRRAKVEELIARGDEEIIRAYQAIKDGTFSDLQLGGEVFKNAAIRRYASLLPYATELYSIEEMQELKLRTLETVMEEMHQARIAVFGKALPRLDFGRLGALTTLEQFDDPFFGGTIDLLPKKVSELADVTDQVKSTEQLLAEATERDVRLNLQSEINRLRGEAWRIEQEISLLKKLLPSDATTEKLVAHYANIARDNPRLVWHDGLVGNTNPMAPLARELRKRYRRIGPAYARNYDERVSLLLDHVQDFGRATMESALAGKKPDMTAYSVSALIETLGQDLTAAERTRLQRQVLGRAYDLWKKAFVGASETAQLRLTQAFMAAVESLADRAKSGRPETLRILDDLVDTVAAHSRSTAVVRQVFASRFEALDGTANQGAIMMAESEGMKWQFSTARSWFTNEQVGKLVDARAKFLLRKIRHGRSGFAEALDLLDQEIDFILGLGELTSKRALAASIEPVLGAVAAKCPRVVPGDLRDEILASRYGLKSPRGWSAERLIGEISKALDDPGIRSELSGTLRFETLHSAASGEKAREKLYRLAAREPRLFGRPVGQEFTLPEIEKYYEPRRKFVEWARSRGAHEMSAAEKLLLQRFEQYPVGPETRQLAPYFPMEENHASTLRDELWIPRFEREIGGVSRQDPKRYEKVLRRMEKLGASLDKCNWEFTKVMARQPFEERLVYRAAYAKLALPPLKNDGSWDDYLIKGELDKLLTNLKLRPADALETPGLSEALMERSLALSFEHSPPSAARDELFLRLWEKTKDLPSVPKLFLDEKTVSKLYFDGTKRSLALWQLERKYGLAELGKIARRERTGADTQRKVAADIRKSVELQYPEPTFQRDAIIDAVEKKMLSTVRETEAFATLRLNRENWYSAAELDFLDLPSVISGTIPSAHDKFEVIEFITGQRTQLPQFVGRLSTDRQEPAEAALRSFRTRFVQANAYSRTAALMSFLDDETGLRAEKAVAEELDRLILGSRADDAVVRAMFSAYLESIPEAQTKVVLGNVLASFVENGEKGAFSIRPILEAMGPFGVKAGQFLRSSGLASPELAAQLTDLFDRALEPSRGKVIEDLRKILGKRLKGLTSLGEIVGAGSVNYGFRAILAHPVTGEDTEVMLRVQRDAVEGTVANENEIWEKAIAKLRAHPDPEVRNAAYLADEAREASFATLKKGGTELDLSIERGRYADAREAYGRGARETRSGFRVEVSRPLDEFQALVPAELQKKFSFYEYVPTTSWKELQGTDLGKRLAQDVVDGEMTALLNGKFDPDVHRGNWLVDTKNGRLVRIDYAQFTEEAKELTRKARDTLKLVADPWLSRFKANRLHSAIDGLFEVSGAPAIRVADVRKALAAKGLPASKDIPARLFFIHEEIEKSLRAAGHLEARVRFTSPLRKTLLSVGKLLSYEEFMVAGDLKSQLAGHLGYKWSDALWSGTQKTADRAIGAVVDCLGAPERALRTLFGGKQP